MTDYIIVAQIKGSLDPNDQIVCLLAAFFSNVFLPLSVSASVKNHFFFLLIIFTSFIVLNLKKCSDC